MSSTLHFPDAATMTKCLSSHPLLQTPFYQEKGITTAIVELAVEKFANKDINKKNGIKMGATLLIEDLQRGEDEVTEKTLPNFGEWANPSIIWAQILESTEIFDCANSVKA